MVKSIWLVELFYNNILDSTHEFATFESALVFYNSKLGAIRFGLSGWSVNYPREISRGENGNG